MYNRRGQLIRNPDRWLEQAAARESDIAVFNRLGERITEPWKYWESVKAKRPDYPAGLQETAEVVAGPPSSTDVGGAVIRTAQPQHLAAAHNRTGLGWPTNADGALGAAGDEPGEDLLYSEAVRVLAEYYGYQPVANEKPGVLSYVFVDKEQFRIRIAYWPSAGKVAASVVHASQPRVDVPRQRVAIYWLDRFFREPQAFIRE